MAFKRTFTDPVPEKMEQRYREKGIDAYHGKARFVGKNTLQVSDDVLEGKHILLASGAEPIKLNIPGEQHLMDNESFLAMETLPKRIALVGGGFIAAEFSHIAARAGAKVTILQHADRMLKEFDPDLVGWLMASFDALGIDVQTKTTVEPLSKSREGTKSFPRWTASSRWSKQTWWSMRRGARPPLMILILALPVLKPIRGS